MMQEGKRDAEMTLHFWRQNDTWDQTANLLSAVHNLAAAFADGKTKTPDQLNPTLNSGDCEDDPAVREEQIRAIAKRREKLAAEKAAQEAQEAVNGN